MKRNIFLIVAIFFLTGLYFLPQLASTGWVKQQIEKHLEAQLGGTVSIEHLSLSWFSTQTCKQVSWTHNEKNFSAKADKVLITSSLIDCIKHKEKALKLAVEGAIVSCEANMRFIKKKRKNLSMQFSPIFATIHKGNISFNRTEIDVTESLKVITWGQVDFGQNALNLTLGLPPKTLKKLFRAKDLPESYLLEIPVETKMSSKAFENHLLAFFIKNYGTLNRLSKPQP